MKATKCSLITNYTNTLPLWLVIHTIQQQKSIQNVFAWAAKRIFLNCAFSNVSSLSQSGGGQIAGSGRWLTGASTWSCLCSCQWDEMSWKWTSVCCAVNILPVFSSCLMSSVCFTVIRLMCLNESTIGTEKNDFFPFSGCCGISLKDSD